MSLNDREIRPKSLLEKYEKLYEKDVNLLKKNTVYINCPACNSNNFKLKYHKLGFNFVLCKKCKTLYVNPRPNEISLERFYTNTESAKCWDKIFSKTKKNRIEKIFKPRMKIIKKLMIDYGLNNSKTMTEVGAGYGWFCELAKKQKLSKEIIAIEPSPLYAKHCKKIKGIKVIQSTIEKNLENLNSELIVTFETVHLLFDPKLFLQSCYTGMKKNGLLFITLTNYLGFDIQILQEKSNYIRPTFLNLFNPNSMELLLKSIGFRNIKILTPGLMDVKIVLNYLKEGKINGKNYPFIQFLSDIKEEEFVNELQTLLKKYIKSSHMLVVAQK